MKVVTRTCIANRKKYDRNELFRIVKNKNDEVSLDLSYKKEGFGAYVKKDETSIKKAINSKGLNRKLKCNVESNIYEQMLEIIGSASE